MVRTVYAAAGKIEATSTHRCCAERNVFDKWVRLAIKQGVPPHAIISWIRRKSGGVIVVERYLHDNTPACSIPCVFCRKEIQKYDFIVKCTVRTGDDAPFEGRLSDPTSPPSCLTCGQRRMLSA